jgi:hypothetical protein
VPSGTFDDAGNGGGGMTRKTRAAAPTAPWRNRITGSGEDDGRRCHTLEIDPTYWEVVVRGSEHFSGETVVRVDD